MRGEMVAAIVARNERHCVRWTSKFRRINPNGQPALRRLTGRNDRDVTLPRGNLCSAGAYLLPRVKGASKRATPLLSRLWSLWEGIFFKPLKYMLLVLSSTCRWSSPPHASAPLKS